MPNTYRAKWRRKCARKERKARTDIGSFPGVPNTSIAERGLGWGGATVAALLLALTFLLPAPGLARSEPRLQDLRFEDAAGRQVSIAPPAVLLFWASWCRPCRLEVALLNRMRPEVPVYLVDELVSELDQAALQAEVARLRLRHPVLYDRWGEVGDRLAVRGLPTLIRFDRQGVPKVRALGFRSARELARLLAPE